MKQFILLITSIITGLIGMYFGYSIGSTTGRKEIHATYQQLFMELQPKFKEAQMTVLAKNALPLPEDRKGQMLIIDSMFYYNGKAHAFGECQDLIAIKLGLKPQP